MNQKKIGTIVPINPNLAAFDGKNSTVREDVPEYPPCPENVFDGKENKFYIYTNLSNLSSGKSVTARVYENIIKPRKNLYGNVDFFCSTAGEKVKVNVGCPIIAVVGNVRSILGTVIEQSSSKELLASEPNTSNIHQEIRQALVEPEQSTIIYNCQLWPSYGIVKEKIDMSRDELTS